MIIFLFCSFEHEKGLKKNVTEVMAFVVLKVLEKFFVACYFD